ncbi:bifunctional nuclease family protein [soil metagenome]|uniref:bifunctional nuclease family protein n=1 Tax=Leptolyngbya sp. BC1307 TaxID=2029589 RepID=UPI000EFD79A9|nr:bifunctional nuclease family protein [Leptolyngbya sp. BC1307]
MIEMTVAGIAVDAGSRNPIVLLRDGSQRRQLPIFISPEQARAINSVLEGETPTRPMTHDLLVNLLTAWDMTLQRVVIHALRDNTFYAVMTVGRGKKKKELDARPSDAISVALRVNAPIWVMEEVVVDAAMPVDQEADAAEKEAFHAFLSDISPADFAERGHSI